MSTFLGIGLGPIQTGIFLSGAQRGGIERIVVAEVDAALTAAIRAAGTVTINVAGRDRIVRETVERVEIYNPLDPADLEKLTGIAAEADEIATALPGVSFYRHIAPWLRTGFARQPERRRFIYTAENDNYAAEKLAEELGPGFPRTFCLNTVIGKMSKAGTIRDTPEFELSPLCPGTDRMHLVEEFNRILINTVPEIEQRRVAGLHQQTDLYPFEEAKLYGHNAIHFLLGWYASQRGLNEMHELTEHPDLIDFARSAFIEECGTALCRKWRDVDPLFTQEGFRQYVEDLLVRMVNPFLRDRVDRIIRDLPRKLSAGDRVIGTVRMCLDQQIVPVKFIHLASDCLRQASINTAP